MKYRNAVDLLIALRNENDNILGNPDEVRHYLSVATEGLSDPNSVEEFLRNAFTQLECAREDADLLHVSLDGTDDEGNVECLFRHLDDVSHWLQELANVFDIEL